MTQDLEALKPYIINDSRLLDLADQVDPDARSVVARLRAANYETYLVGGCVRDLLLGREPKDFDVATEAHPSELRMLFRNCRLIGRRFRLAHLHFAGGKIIETATFRANPLDEADDLPEDLLINRDNVFGNSEQDARRRDFTVNGLFFEPEAGQIIDYVGGMRDLKARLLRVIGDPDVRLPEDPVRIMRAVKFAAKLKFVIATETYTAMQNHVTELGRCSVARLVEELDRLLQCGSAQRAMDIALDVGIVGALLPELDQALRAQPELRQDVLALLGAYDQSIARGFHASRAAALALLYWPLVRDQGPDQGLQWLKVSLEAMGERLHNPKRDRDRVQQIISLALELQQRPETASRSRLIVRRAAFGEALLLVTLDLYQRGQDLQAVGIWKATARHFGQDFAALPGAPLPGSNPRRRGGRRPRRGNHDRRRPQNNKRGNP